LGKAKLLLNPRKEKKGPERSKPNFITLCEKAEKKKSARFEEVGREKQLVYRGERGECNSGSNDNRSRRGGGRGAAYHPVYSGGRTTEIGKNFGCLQSISQEEASKGKRSSDLAIGGEKSKESGLLLPKRITGEGYSRVASPLGRRVERGAALRKKKELKFPNPAQPERGIQSLLKSRRGRERGRRAPSTNKKENAHAGLQTGRETFFKEERKGKNSTSFRP